MAFGIFFFGLILVISYFIVSEILNGTEEKRITNLLALLTIISGLIALQASWPMLMSRISIEDISQEGGVFFGDRIGANQYQTVKEAIVKVKPPLFPLFPSFTDRSYPIAENFTLLDTTHSLNLWIDSANDRKSIKIKLGPITAWSFDEVTGRIKYRSDGKFNFDVSGTNITELGKYYRNFAILNNNLSDFSLPVDVVNLTFLIEKNTPAWTDLKKWVENGSCVQARFSDQWDYRNSTRHYVMPVNDGRKIISKDTLNSSISLKMFYVRVEPQEQITAYAIFEETNCNGY